MDTHKTKAQLIKELEALRARVKSPERSVVALEQGEEYLRSVAENAPIGISLYLNDNVLYVNPAFAHMFGYDDGAEIAGTHFTDLVAPQCREEFASRDRRRELGKDVPASYDANGLRKDGIEFPFHAQMARLELPDGVATIGFFTDITERNRAQSIMQARLRLLEFAGSHSMDELLTATLDEIEALTGSTIGFYHFLESDQRTLSLQNWSTNTLKTMCTAEGKGSHYDVARAGVWADCVHERRPVVHNDYASLPHRKGMPEGHALVIREVVVPIFRGNLIKAIIGVGNKASHYDEIDIEIVSQLGDLSWDIVERKQAEEALKEQYSTLHGIINSTNALIFSVDRQYRYTSFNQGHAAIMKALYGAEIETGHNLLDYMTVVEDRETAQRNIDRALAGEQLVEEAYSGEELRSRRYFRVSHGPIKAEAGEIIGVAVLAQDITEHKRAEEALYRRNRELRAISNCNQTLMRAADEQTLLNDICRIICDEAGYRLAWVGYAENDAARTIRPVGWAGFDSGYIADARLSWGDDTERGRGPAGTAIRSGEIVYVQDFVTDPRMTPWRESALQHGYRSGIALPLTDEGLRVFGVLLIYSSEPNAINPDEIRLMEELAGDLAFGITTLRAHVERKRVGEELQNTNEFLRAIIEAAPTAIIGLDLDGKVHTVWNPAAEKMLGWSAQEAMGNFLPSVPVEKEEEFRRFRELIRSGKTLNGIDVQRKRRDGTPIDYSIYASPLHDRDGQITGNVAVLVDIIERKKAEKALQHYTARLETLHEIDQAILLAVTPHDIAASALGRLRELIPCQRASVVIFDFEREEVEILASYVSGRALPEMGIKLPMKRYGIDEELLHSRIFLANDLASQPHLSEIRQTLLEEGIHSIVNVPLVVQGKPIGALNLAATAPASFIDEHIEIAREVADPLAVAIQQARLRERARRHAEELEQRVAERTVELQRAYEQLQALSRVKDEFVSNVSHELRTPITSLKLNQELLRRNPAGQELYIERMKRELDRLNDLIEDLLRLSRLDQGRVQLDLQPVDLNNLAAQYVDDRAPLAESRRLSLTLERMPNLSLAEADAGLLGQALSVLLTNALNYTPAGGQVTITTHQRDIKGQTWVGFSVTDTGPGIPPDEISKLFTRFFRGAVGRKSGASGTGLGLAIAREIVERHRGRIEVASEGVPSHGATFSVWLPAFEAPRP